MKKLYIIFLILYAASASAQMPTGYCTSMPLYYYYFDIMKTSISGAGGFNINQSSTCTSMSPATGSLNLYSDYSASFLYQILTPGATYSAQITSMGPFCDGLTSSYSGGVAVFIDLNRNGTFELPAERVTSSSFTFAGTNGGDVSPTMTFTIPASISVGISKLRVVLSYNETGPNISPCLNATAPYYYGETEDYAVFLGAKKWDYTVSKVNAPDTIAFCGETPQTFNIEVKNVGNQPLTGGKIDVAIRGVEAGSTTNLSYSTTFNSTIINGAVDNFNIGPISFPKDELLEFKFIITHPFDTLKDNDTFVKRINVYKNPVFNLKTDTVCTGKIAHVALINAPKPVFLKWDNEAITDTTSYLIDATQTRSVTVWRGFKCRLDSTLKIVALPSPALSVSNDTVLCIGQKINLTATSNADSFQWDDDPKSTTSTISNIPSVNRTYSVIVKNKIVAGRQCTATDTVRITTANPPARARIIDTVCAGEVATTGLGSTHPDFLYTWANRTETTPIIHPAPTADASYYCRWTFQGCSDKDTVSVKVNPLPNVLISTPTPSICEHFSATLTASGAVGYQWANGLGTSNAITISPSQSTNYIVSGTDSKGCVQSKSFALIVNKQPDIYVYSNKKRDNVCLGDSITIYANGANSYAWNTGQTDSVLRFTPTQSFQWRVIGVDLFGCKDTAEYRMTVKPPFNYKITTSVKGCEGQKVTVTIPAGGIDYQWGNTPLINSTTAEITLTNSTKYQVTVTSPDTCDIVAEIPITVFPKPVIEVSSATVCLGERATIEAKGGLAGQYLWSSDPTNPNNKESVLFTSTTVVTVTGKNDGGCSNEAYATIQVIQPQKVTIKSPDTGYICPTVPITMVATPYGGVWSSDDASTDKLIQGNKFMINTSTSRGSYSIKYTLLDPVHGCRVDTPIIVNIRRTDKCAETTSGILDANNLDRWAVFPNPFQEDISVFVSADKNETATLYIYDVSGRIIYSQNEKLRIGDNRFHIQNQNWANGVYYLELQTESTSRQQKIIKE